MTEPSDHFRSATEDTVAQALDRSYISLPIEDAASALEFFNRMLDVLTGESDREEAEDVRRITEAAEKAKR